jgi:peptidoglycan hydrolase CwlO-like protein
MQNSLLNLGYGSPESANPDGSYAPDEEVKQMGERIEQTNSDVQRMRMRMDRQENENERHAQKTKILSIVLSVFIVILVVCLWLALTTQHGQSITALQMPRLQNVTNSLGERVQSLEAKTAASLPALSTHMNELGASMLSALESTQAAATQASQRVRADLTKSIQAIQSRVAGVESNQREASGHVSQLESEIAGLKRELAAMHEEAATAAGKISELQTEQQNRVNDVSRIDQKMASHQTTLDSLSNRFNRKQVEFQLTNNKTTEIAPGIFLGIRSANVGKQEVDGTLQLAAESRMFKIRGLGIQKPMSLYASGETRPMELVFTGVAKNRVSGYILLPE